MSWMYILYSEGFDFVYGIKWSEHHQEWAQSIGLCTTYKAKMENKIKIWTVTQKISKVLHKGKTEIDQQKSPK